MTLTLSLTLTCDLCSRHVILIPALGCTAAISTVVDRRKYPHSGIEALKVDRLVEGEGNEGWVTRTRKRKMVDLCGECASGGKKP